MRSRRRRGETGKARPGGGEGKERQGIYTLSAVKRMGCTRGNEIRAKKTKKIKRA